LLLFFSFYLFNLFNTLELERERPILASDTRISFVNMEYDADLVEFNRQQVRSSALLYRLRVALPLYGFFKLFGQTMGSVAELKRLLRSGRGWLTCTARSSKSWSRALELYRPNFPVRFLVPQEVHHHYQTERERRGSQQTAEHARSMIEQVE
jgi:hypothetical protein